MNQKRHAKSRTEWDPDRELTILVLFSFVIWPLSLIFVLVISQAHQTIWTKAWWYFLFLVVVIATCLYLTRPVANSHNQRGDQ